MKRFTGQYAKDGQTSEQQLESLRNAVSVLCGHLPGVSQEEQLEEMVKFLSLLRASVGADGNEQLLEMFLEANHKRQ